MVIILLNRYPLPHSGTLVPIPSLISTSPMTISFPFLTNKTDTTYKYGLSLSELLQDYPTSGNGRYSILVDQPNATMSTSGMSL